MSSQLDSICQTHQFEDSQNAVEKKLVFPDEEVAEDDIVSLLSTEENSDDDKCRVGVSDDGSSDDEPSGISDEGALDQQEPPSDNDELAHGETVEQAENDNQEEAEEVQKKAAKFTFEDTLMIFDWDDTVLPSTWLQLQGLGLDERSVVSEEQRVSLDSLADRAIKTLEQAKKYGTVVFITNAETGWIELSCQKFLPSLWLFMQSVRFLSARSLYETDDIQCPSMWKWHAFEKEIDNFARDLPLGRRLNIINFGDSLFERDALFRATVKTHCCRKNLKFLEQPDWAVLARQHEFVNAYFQQIVDHEFSMDLCLRCS